MKTNIFSHPAPIEPDLDDYRDDDDFPHRYITDYEIWEEEMKEYNLLITETLPEGEQNQ